MPTRSTSRSARTEAPRAAARRAACLFVTLLCGCLPQGADFDPIDLFAPSFSQEEEREIGFAFDRELQEQVELIDDPLIAGFVNDLGREIERQAEPQPFVYRFRLIRSRSLNAFAVFGGYVYLHSGTLAAASSLDELAGVMGHEVAHVRLRHHAKLQERSQLPDLVASLAGLAAAAVTGEPGVLLATQGVNVALKLRFSREFEAEADREGTRYMAEAGYDPRGIARFFQRLLERRPGDTQGVPPYLFSHPDVELRIDAVNSYAERLPEIHREQGELDAEFRAAQARLAMLESGARSGVPPDAPDTDASPAEAPREHFEAAERALAEGRPALAARRYQRALELDPSRALVFLRQGEAYEAMREPQKAVFAYEQAARRAGEGGAMRQRAMRAVERLSFTVVEASALSLQPGARLVWRARLGPRFRDRTAQMRLRWQGPDGSLGGESPVRDEGRGQAVSEWTLGADDPDGGRFTAVVLLDGHEVSRHAEQIAPLRPR